MDIIINEQLARKVKETVEIGLSCGLGKAIPGQMCVEAAVNYACGLPHGDNPSCVGAAVRSFKITLNDNKHWSSDKARANGMIKIAIAQLGSNTIDQVEFSKKLAFKTITVLLSKFLKEKGFLKEAKNCKLAQTLIEAKNAAYAAYASINVCAAYVAAAAAAAANAAAANAYAANANAYAADAADVAAYAANAAAYAEKYLILSADICLEVLKEMKSPGYKFLYLLN